MSRAVEVDEVGCPKCRYRGCRSCDPNWVQKVCGRRRWHQGGTSCWRPRACPALGGGGDADVRVDEGRKGQ